MDTLPESTPTALIADTSDEGDGASTETGIALAPTGDPPAGGMCARHRKTVTEALEWCYDHECVRGQCLYIHSQPITGWVAASMMVDPYPLSAHAQAVEAEQALKRKTESAAALPCLTTRSNTTCKVCLQLLDAQWADEKRAVTELPLPLPNSDEPGGERSPMLGPRLETEDSSGQGSRAAQTDDPRDRMETNGQAAQVRLQNLKRVRRMSDRRENGDSGSDTTPIGCPGKRAAGKRPRGKEAAALGATSKGK